MNLKFFFKLDSVNILDYYRIKKLVQIFIRKCGCSNLTKPIGPGRPAHLNILLKSRSGASDMYKVLNKAEFQPKMKIKWSIELGQDIEESKWRQIFKVCFKFKSDASLTWFQYRILYRIIGVRKYLKLTNIEELSTCRLCTNNEETILHLFYNCIKTKDFWENVSNWMRIKLKLTWFFDEEQVIFGYLSNDRNCDQIILLILCAKWYMCKK